MESQYDFLFTQVKKRMAVWVRMRKREAKCNFRAISFPILEDVVIDLAATSNSTTHSRYTFAMQPRGAPWCTDPYTRMCGAGSARRHGNSRDKSSTTNYSIISTMQNIADVALCTLPAEDTYNDRVVLPAESAVPFKISQLRRYYLPHPSLCATLCNHVQCPTCSPCKNGRSNTRSTHCSE